MLTLDYITHFVEALNKFLPYKFQLVSWIRPDSDTHRTGLAIDLAPRAGSGYIKHLNNQSPGYNRSNMIRELEGIAPALKRMFPRMVNICVEVNHLHIDFSPVATNWVSLMLFSPDNMLYRDQVNHPNSPIEKHKIIYI